MEMPRAKLIVVLFLAIVVSTAVGQEESPNSPGVPPRFVTVLKDYQEDGVVDFVSVLLRFVPEIVDGAGTVDNPIYETQVERLVLKSAQVFDPSGKKLSADVVWKRIAVGKAVVVSGDGNEVRAVYLNALAKDTVVFVAAPMVLPAAEKTDRNPQVPRKR
jgi:hypothetical protein